MRLIDWLFPPRRRTYTPAEKARIIRNLLAPGLYRWEQENPALQFDLNAEPDGRLRITATPAEVKQAAYFVDPMLVGRYFDRNGPWEKLHDSMLAGILESARDRGLLNKEE